MINYGFGFYPLGFIPAIISLGIFTYTILKYHLLDIRIALTRAGIFIIVYLFVLGIPFLLGYKYDQWKLATWVTVVLASAGPFIYLVLKRQTENILLKEQRRYQEALRRLSATLSLVKDLERLLKLVVLKVSRLVRVEFACIYLANDNKLLQKHPYTIKGLFLDLPKEVSFDSSIIRYIISKRAPVFIEELSSMADGFNLTSGLIIPSFVRNRLLGFLLY